jgi:hypothetical protein
MTCSSPKTPAAGTEIEFGQIWQLVRRLNKHTNGTRRERRRFHVGCDDVTRKDMLVMTTPKLHVALCI